MIRSLKDARNPNTPGNFPGYERAELQQLASGTSGCAVPPGSGVRVTRTLPAALYVTRTRHGPSGQAAAWLSSTHATWAAQWRVVEDRAVVQERLIGRVL